MDIDEFKENLLKFKSNDDNEYISSKVDEFMDFVRDNDLYQYAQDIYSDDVMWYIIKERVEDTSWINIKYMLDGITDTTYDYYYEDGYGNFRNVTNKDIDYIIEDIVDNYELFHCEYELLE